MKNAPPPYDQDASTVVLPDVRVGKHSLDPKPRTGWDGLTVVHSPRATVVAPQAESAPPPAVSSRRGALRISGAALTILGILLVSFFAQVSAVGFLQHHRAQHVAYAALRDTLAQGTAPVAQRGTDGKLLPLGSPVALLDIPSIGVHEVIGEGTSSGVLTAGPGHKRDSVLPGQPGTSVVLGRRATYGAPFLKLGMLAPGASITVTSGLGRSEFVVLDTRVGDTPAPALHDPAEGRLVLGTANGVLFMPEGAIWVDAKRTSQALPASRRVIGVGGIPSGEEALAVDRTGLILLVLLMQLLLVGVLAVVWVRHRVSRWHAWVVAVPTLGAIGLMTADQVARLLPNLT